MRMSFWRKIEMSALIGGGRPYDRGADGVESARTGQVEGSARIREAADTAIRGSETAVIEHTAGEAISGSDKKRW